MTLLQVALIVLLSETWSHATGHNPTTEKISTSSHLRVCVFQKSSFKQTEDVNLTCGHKTWTKDNLMYILWKIKLKHRSCDITFHIDGRNQNDCSDRKSLRNTTEAQPVLHIPNFSFKDVGVYTCEAVYSGGSDNYCHNVSIIVPPLVSSWIEWRGDKKVAVCRAERGFPAANVSLSRRDTLLNSTEDTVLDSDDGFITVKKSVELDFHNEPENITCTVSHLYWDEPQVTVPKLIPSQSNKYTHSAAYATIATSAVFCLVLLFLGIKKLINLRRCQKLSSKSPEEEEVEVVEPYESYVQRVNSIYNSSRDLFA